MIKVTLKDGSIKEVEQGISIYDVAKQIKAGFSKERGTGKFIGYPIKEYITNYNKRVPNYDTGKYMQHEPQNVQRHELKEDYFVYDVAIVNNTE